MPSLNHVRSLMWVLVLVSSGCMVDFGLKDPEPTTDTNPAGTDTAVPTGEDSEIPTGNGTASLTDSDGYGDADTDVDRDSDTNGDTDSDSTTDSATDRNPQDGGMDSGPDASTDTEGPDAGKDGGMDGGVASDTEADTETEKPTATETASVTETATATATATASASATDTLGENEDYAARISFAPTIDGVLSEPYWHLDTVVSKLVDGEADNNHVVFDVVWDSAYLYVAVEVIDDSICQGTSIATWNYDSIEVYMDPDNSGDSQYDEHDLQAIIKYQDIDYAEFGENVAPTNRPAILDYGKPATRTGDVGYTIELAIPWAGLGVTPAVGRVIGFDIGINDDDVEVTGCSGANNGTRDGHLVWAGEESNFQTTEFFGDLLLSGFL